MFLDAIFCIHYIKNELYWRKSFSEERFGQLKEALHTINSKSGDENQILEPIKAPSFLQVQLEKERKADEEIRVRKEKIMQNINQS